MPSKHQDNLRSVNEKDFDNSDAYSVNNLMCEYREDS